MPSMRIYQAIAKSFTFIPISTVLANLPVPRRAVQVPD